MSYVLDAGRFGHSLDALAPRYFNHAAVDYNDVIGSGKSKVGFDQVTFEKAAPYVAEDADIALRLTQVLRPRMVAEHVTSVYETLERPLLPVLARMERRGISVDRQVLSRLSGEFAQRGAALEAEVRELAGDPASIPGSPKQLGDILFGKMGLAGRHQDQDRPMVHRRARARRARRAGPSRCRRRSWNGGRSPSSSRPTPTRCPATSTRRRSACTPTTRWPRRRPGGSRRPSRTCRTSRSAPRKAARSAAPSWRRRATSSCRPTIRRSSCGCSPRSPTCRALRAGVHGGARHPRHDGVGNVRRAGEGHAGRRAPPRQGDQFRHHLRHLGVRAREPARASRARKPAPTSRSISSASPASATTWTRPRRSRRRTAMC